MKALLTNYHQSPRKVRLVADLVRGKTISQAKAALAFLAKKSSPAMEKLLDSAVANARVAGKDPESLFVKTIAVNKGTAMRRFKPMARGRAARYQKVLSIISIELGESKSAEKKVAKKSTKKAVAKTHKEEEK